MTCEGRVLRWSDVLKSCGIDDGCIVEIMNMMRGGGKNRNKKIKAETKPAASLKSREPVRGQQEHDEEKITQKSEPVQGQQETKNDKSLLSRDSGEHEVILHIGEIEGTRKITAGLAEGSFIDMEQWIPM